MTAAASNGGNVAGRPELVSEPMFEELVHLGGEEYVLSGSYSSDSMWLLDQHRTADGHARVPCSR